MMLNNESTLSLSDDNSDDINDDNSDNIENTNDASETENIIKLDNNLENNAPNVIKNLIKSNQLVKSNKKNEFHFNKPIQDFCLTNVTDDIKSLRYYIELLNTPRAKIKDPDLLKIKNENKYSKNFLIPSGFQLIGSYQHHSKKIKLGIEYYWVVFFYTTKNNILIYLFILLFFFFTKIVLSIPSEDINSTIIATIDDSFLVISLNILIKIIKRKLLNLYLYTGLICKIIIY